MTLLTNISRVYSLNLENKISILPHFSKSVQPPLNWIDQFDFPEYIHCNGMIIL